MDIEDRLTSKIAVLARVHHPAELPSGDDLKAEGVGTFVDKLVDRMSEERVTFRALLAMRIRPEKELNSYVHKTFKAYQQKIENNEAVPEIEDFPSGSGIRLIIDSFRNFADGQHEELFDRAERFGCFVVDRARKSESRLREAS